MVVITHVSESWDDASKNPRTSGVTRCFSNKRNLKEKTPTVFAPKKEIHYYETPIYIDHYMKQSVKRWNVTNVAWEITCSIFATARRHKQPPAVIWVTEFWWVRVGVPIFFSRMSPKKQDWDMAQKCRQNDQIYLEIYLQKREVDLASLTIKPVVGTLKRSWMEFRRSWKTGCRTFFSSTAYQ